MHAHVKQELVGENARYVHADTQSTVNPIGNLEFFLLEIKFELEDICDVIQGVSSSGGFYAMCLLWYASSFLKMT